MALKLLSPREYPPRPELENLGAGWSYSLDYAWALPYLEAYRGKALLEVGVTDFGEYAAGLYNLNRMGVDRAPHPRASMRGEFDDINFSVFRPNVILWISSLEHNSLSEMERLYQKSMDGLAKGGAFLATVPIARRTEWFADAQQTNLSIEDAERIFGEPMTGEFETVWTEYREDKYLRQKYISRFGRFGKDDPAYIVGAVCKAVP